MGGGGLAHVDRGRGQKSNFFVDVINGRPLRNTHPHFINNNLHHAGAVLV